MFDTMPFATCEPFVATEPMPLNVAEVAFVELHERVVEPPYCTFEGFAEIAHDGACGGGVVTVMVV